MLCYHTSTTTHTWLLDVNFIKIHVHTGLHVLVTDCCVFSPDSLVNSFFCLVSHSSILPSSFFFLMCVCVCVFECDSLCVYACMHMCVRDWLTKSEGTSLIQVASPSCSLLSLTHEWFPQPSSPPLQWTPCSSPVHSTHWSALRVQQQWGRQGWKNWLASEGKMVKEWHSTYRKNTCTCVQCTCTCCIVHVYIVRVSSSGTRTTLLKQPLTVGVWTRLKWAVLLKLD